MQIHIRMVVSKDYRKPKFLLLEELIFKLRLMKPNGLQLLTSNCLYVDSKTNTQAYGMCFHGILLKKQFEVCGHNAFALFFWFQCIGIVNLVGS